MSGHSKWAGIKHKKAAEDAKRGQLFTKLTKEIIVAAREGGGSPDTNARLRSAVAKAKAGNMPMDNIDRAIKKGTGELPGVVYEDAVYEGYGPGGVALLIQVTTDNKNRTLSDVRTILTKRNGSLAGSGSVAWQFTQKGYILVPKDVVSEDKLLAIILEAGAEDLTNDPDSDEYEITTEIADFESVKSALHTASIEPRLAELTMIPQSVVTIDDADAKAVLGLVEALEDNDDVQNVYANFDIPDKVMEELNAE